MKKILALLIVFNMGCSEFFPNDGSFVVDDIDFTNDKTKCIYRLSPSKGRGSVYYIDTIGKYKIGDTLNIK
jgi:hypothetical protein